MYILKTSSKSLTHIGFRVGLVLKGLFAISEIIGGFAMIFLNPDRVNQLIALITKNELIEDPNDIFMNFLISHIHAFSVSSQQFAIIYLLVHGIIKLVVICLLWVKKLWAYPLSIVVFAGFVVYQMYHYVSSHSVMLLILTAVDLIMIVLTIIEYRSMKNTKNLEENGG